MYSFNLKTYLLIKLTEELAPRTFIPKTEMTQKPCDTEAFSQVPNFPKYTFRVSGYLIFKLFYHISSIRQLPKQIAKKLGEKKQPPGTCHYSSKEMKSISKL